jgi:hypothetical protein
MTTQALNTPLFALRPAGAMVAFFATLTKALAFASGAQARFDEIQRLQALSDAELAQRGIARDAIVRLVYRDLLAQ